MNALVLALGGMLIAIGLDLPFWREMLLTLGVVTIAIGVKLAK